VVTGFKLEIWVHKSLEGKADPVTNFTCRRAETITGTIGTTWINTSTGRLKSAMGDWGCRKVVQDQSDEGAETFKLFELWTENPLYLEKGTDSAWTFEIILLFQLPGSLHDQVATVSRALSSPTTPGPCSSFNNIAQHLSRPANLALNASSRPEEELPYVYLLQEALAAASPYLEGVVEAGYDTFATRSFDGRDDFDPVDDDSDDEEDTKRYNLMNEGELSGDEDEERRSEAPEPAKGKSEEEEVSQACSFRFSRIVLLLFFATSAPSKEVETGSGRRFRRRGGGSGDGSSCSTSESSPNLRHPSSSRRYDGH